MGSGILLQFLRDWPQRSQDVGHLLDYSQWASNKLASLGGQSANNLDNRQTLDCRANLDYIQAWKGHFLVDRRGNTGIGEDSKKQGTVMTLRTEAD